MAGNQYIVDFDPGTNSRAFLVDDLCKVATLAARPFKQSSPQPGCVELYQLEIRSSRRVVIRESLSIDKHSKRDIAVVCITDRHKTPIYLNRSTAAQHVDREPAWQDRRTVDFCQPLSGDRHAPEIEAKIVPVADPNFLVRKLNWLQENGGRSSPGCRAGKIPLGTKKLAHVEPE